MPEANSYSRERERLEEIVIQTRAKDVPLEKSLDLYDEALAIGARCVEQLEQSDFTSEELESLNEHPEIGFSGIVVERLAGADGADGAADAAGAGADAAGADAAGAGADAAGAEVVGTAAVADLDYAFGRSDSAGQADSGGAVKPVVLSNSAIAALESAGFESTAFVRSGLEDADDGADAQDLISTD